MAQKNATKIKVNPVYVQIYVGFGGLLLAYLFATLAIDRGSLWLYLLSFITLYYGVVYVYRLVKTLMKKNDKTGRTRRTAKASAKR